MLLKNITESDFELGDLRIKAGEIVDLLDDEADDLLALYGHVVEKVKPEIEAPKVLAKKRKK